jgi:hypothetical protein
MRRLGDRRLLARAGRLAPGARASLRVAGVRSLASRASHVACATVADTPSGAAWQ